MTYVNVTTTQVETIINEETGTVITVTSPGPQGPIGPPGTVGSLGQISNVDTTSVQDGSVLVYNASEQKFKADSTWTTNSLADGGNF